MALIRAGALSTLPSASELPDLLGRLAAAFVAPSARRGLDGPDLPQLRKAQPYGLLDELAPLSHGYELAHLLQELILEHHIHACHSSASLYTFE
jgi:hypothetical protein